MKYKKTIELIEKAGFKYVGEKPATDVTGGEKVRNYQKDVIGDAKKRQHIHIVINGSNEDDFLPMFSFTVPEKLRDEVYGIMNVSSNELPQQRQSQMGIGT